MILKFGARGYEVFQLTEKLHDFGYLDREEITNVFTDGVEEAVKQFQERHLDSVGHPLEEDGIVGILTNNALLYDNNFYDVKKITPKHLKVAIGEISAGGCEIGSNNSGKWVEKYVNNIGNTPNNWCAGFVSWCVFQAYEKMPFSYSLGAKDIYNKFLKKNWIYNPDITDIKPGDIVFWWRGKKESWQGHIGIIYSSRNGILNIIEGNKGSFPAKVKIFSYKIKNMKKILGFGRIDLE